MIPAFLLRFRDPFPFMSFSLTVPSLTGLSLAGL